MCRSAKLLILVSTAALPVFAGVALAQNQAWGDIAGNVVWKGPAIAVRPPVPAGGGCPAIVPPGPVVNPKNDGLADVFVWLEPAAKGAVLPIHPDLKKLPKDNPVMDQPACAFIPHSVGLREGQSLIAKNGSPIAHNFKWTGNPVKNPGGNVLLPPNTQKELKGLVEEKLAITVECNVHPGMRAYLKVFSHPYFAVTDADGNFTIKNAPAGNYTIKYLHGDLGFPGGAAGKNGMPIAIAKGKNTLNPVSYK